MAPREVCKKWRKVALYYVLPSLFIMSAFLLKLEGWRQGVHAERDYVTAKKAFLRWDQLPPEEGKEDFLILHKLLKKHPELHAYYDASIGQNFLALNNVQEATFYVEQTLKRTKQSYYSDYAQTSLMISRGEYGAALKRAQKLKNMLLENENHLINNAIFAFNLMRIAILCQELGENAEELEAWKEIKFYSNCEGSRPNTGFDQLLRHFTVQEISLLDYILAREKEMQKPVEKILLEEKNLG